MASRCRIFCSTRVVRKRYVCRRRMIGFGYEYMSESSLATESRPTPFPSILGPSSTNAREIPKPFDFAFMRAVRFQV